MSSCMSFQIQFCGASPASPSSADSFVASASPRWSSRQSSNGSCEVLSFRVRASCGDFGASQDFGMSMLSLKLDKTRLRVAACSSSMRGASRELSAMNLDSCSMRLKRTSMATRAESLRGSKHVSLERKACLLLTCDGHRLPGNDIHDPCSGSWSKPESFHRTVRLFSYCQSDVFLEREGELLFSGTYLDLAVPTCHTGSRHIFPPVPS